MLKWDEITNLVVFILVNEGDIEITDAEFVKEGSALIGWCNRHEVYWWTGGVLWSPCLVGALILDSTKIK